MEQTLPENGFFEKVLDKSKKSVIIALVPAGVAHPVERHLAKVEVASSSLVTRSIIAAAYSKKAGRCFFLLPEIRGMSVCR